jgi:hypothetical protein
MFILYFSVLVSHLDSSDFRGGNARTQETLSYFNLLYNSIHSDSDLDLYLKGINVPPSISISQP